MTPEELKAAVAQFEQSGGLIQEVARGASAYYSPPKPITDPVLLSQVAESTVGVVELAKQAKRSAHTLYRAARQLGIEFPNSREARKKRRAELAPIVRELAPKMGQAAVGKKLGIGRIVVRLIAEEHGIEFPAKKVKS